MKLDHTTRVVHSALWAAAGDALGWITELARDGTVRARAGVEKVTQPIEWRRIIGGRSGVRVILPAGTYSDDTQLRLSVCRSIRGDGAFDVEAFARIELTAWQGYALGAGNGTKAAAANLSKRGVNWFSNFFENKAQRYVAAGGNGAAMRVQPHVWVSDLRTNAFLLPVIRDALTSHGHVHGFCGAAFHAVALADAFRTQSIPGLDSWREYALTLKSIPALVSEDRQLEEFWRPAWEQKTGQPLEHAVASIIEELLGELDRIAPIVSEGSSSSYEDLLESLGCFDERYRGSGLKTALAATALAWLYRNSSPESALVAAASALGSDTDTIATMCGALIGAVIAEAPTWPVQDRPYIEREARRLAKIAGGTPQDEFAYPDVAKWQAPQTQSDVLGRFGTDFALSGLGIVHATGKEYVADDAVWQWMELPFGQTVLAKRRRTVRRRIGSEQLPGERRAGRGLTKLPTGDREPGLPFVSANEHSYKTRKTTKSNQRDMTYVRDDHHRQSAPMARAEMLDYWTDEVIRSNFDDRVLGHFFNRCVDEFGTIEGVMAFAGIVAKAKIARARRMNR